MVSEPSEHDITQRIAAPPPPPTESGGGTGRIVLVVGLVLVLIIGGVWFFFLRDTGAVADFTAVDDNALALQQACFDSGLYYDQFGNCYSIDPASILEADRPNFVVAAGTIDDVVGAESTAGPQAPGSQTNASGGSGPVAPSGTSNSGSSGGAGQSDSSGASGSSGSSGSTSSSGGTSSGDTSSSGGTSSGDTSSSGGTSSGGTTNSGETTAPAAKPSPTTAAPAAAPIVATTNNEWVFRMSKTVPEDTNGNNCEIPDGGGMNSLTPECQVYQAAYSGSASFQCDHSANGAFSCPKHNDGNRDNTLSGSVTRSAIDLTRTQPGSTFAMKGSTVQDGTTAGEVCDISGTYTQNFTMNGQAVSQQGTYTGARNAPGC